MIKAVTFDLDGTLIDSTEAIVESFFHTFDILGAMRPERSSIVDSIGYVLEEQFAQLTHHDPVRCVAIYREHYAKIACDMTFLIEGAADCLERLAAAGLKLGFATSKQRRFAEMILAHLEALDRFCCRLGPDDVTHPKPHPEAVLRSAEMLGVAPDEMLFVGDTHFDVLAARAAGVRCIAVATGYETREQLEALEPEVVLDTLEETADYILNCVVGEKSFSAADA